MRGNEMGGGLRRLDNTGGWGGRDRTSEWRNQNPLPYRLATPQLAALENDGTTAYRRFPPPPPVYRGRAAISTAGQAKSLPRRRPPWRARSRRRWARRFAETCALWLRGHLSWPTGQLRDRRFRGNTAASSRPPWTRDTAMTYRAPINDMLLALNHGAG